MAISTCGKCDGRAFEIKEVEPRGAAFKYFFVQCSSCGVPVGVVEKVNIGAVLQKIAKKIGVSL